MKTETTTGQTERRNVQRVKAPTAGPAIGPWLFAGLAFIGICIAGMMWANAGDGTPAPLPTQAASEVKAAPLPTVEPAEPEFKAPTVTRPERNDNHNHADHGSANINGDQNNVIIDNSHNTTHIHTTRQVTEEYVITPGLRRSKIDRSQVSKDCDDSMVEHHLTLARWYAEK